MIEILEAMESTGVSLLDNDDFLQFAASVPGELGALMEIPPGLRLDVSDEVKRAFLTEEGAQPLDSVEALESALNVLFNYRVEQGLEIIAVPGIAPPPDTSSCSESTGQIAQDI